MRIPFISSRQERIEHFTDSYSSVANEVLADMALNVRLFGLIRAGNVVGLPVLTGVLLNGEIPNSTTEWVIAGLGALGTAHEVHYLANVLPAQTSAIDNVMDEQMQAVTSR